MVYQSQDQDFWPYLEEVRKYPLLSRELEEELGRGIKENDSVARTNLIMSGQRLVVKRAIPLRKMLGAPMMDLIQYGNIGLVRAAEKFDHTRGCRFETCAHPWIMTAIIRGVYDLTVPYGISVPETIRGVQREIQSKSREEGSNEHSLREEALKSVEKVYQTSKEAREEIADFIVLSCYSGKIAGLKRRRTQSLESVAAKEKDPEKILASSFLRKELIEPKILNQREHIIINHRYGDEEYLSYDALGEKLGVSRQTCRVLEKNALDKLEQALQNNGLTI